MSNLNLRTRGCLMILSGPSGCGKTSLTEHLMKDDPSLIQSISSTTRKPRDGEVEGFNYNFIDKIKFDAMASSGQMLEFTEIYGNYYGTPKKQIEDAISSNKDIIFDIDAYGAAIIKQKMPKDCFTIFILPPSIDELKKRLISRNKDSEETIERRVNNAKYEIEQIKHYDYIVQNIDLETAVSQLKAIRIAEKLKRERVVNLESYAREITE